MSQSNLSTLERNARDTANDAYKSASQGAARVGEKIADTYHNVRDRLQEHGADAKAEAGSVAARVKEKAGEVSQDLSAGYAVAKDKLAEGKESAIELFNDLIDSLGSTTAKVGDYVKKNPGKSFAAAAIVGLIATRAMSKRRK